MEEHRDCRAVSFAFSCFACLKTDHDFPSSTTTSPALTNCAISYLILSTWAFFLPSASVLPGEGSFGGSLEDAALITTNWRVNAFGLLPSALAHGLLCWWVIERFLSILFKLKQSLR